jgi:phosphoserine phosphatase
VTSAAATRLALLDVDGTLTGCTSIWQYLLEDRGHWHGAGEDNLAAFMAGRISYEEFCELDVQLLAGESYAGLSRTAAGVPFRQGVVADLSIAVGLTSPTVAADFYIGDSDLSAVCGLL